jgi:hypothetical protein
MFPVSIRVESSDARKLQRLSPTDSRPGHSTPDTALARVATVQVKRPTA